VAHAIDDMLKVVKEITPSIKQSEEQRRSFAYGNTAFENDLITREMVDEQADCLEKEKHVERGLGKAQHKGA